MKIVYYDDIPLEIIGKKILEIGVHPRILNSRIWPKISQGSYTGIDVVIREADKLTGLDIIQADILDYEITDKYDTIILIEVMEHIHFAFWKDLIQKFIDVLVPSGYLIISTPYNQKPFHFLKYYEHLHFEDNYRFHTVFAIDRTLMRYFLPKCQIKIITSFWWRQDNAGLIHASLRFIKRLLFGISPIKRNIMVFWQKN